MSAPLNKTMEREDLETPQSRRIVNELNALVSELHRRRLPVSAWYGGFELAGRRRRLEQANRGYGYVPLPGAPDDARFPWYLCWEIAWLVLGNDFKPGQRLLDLGGSSSLFSYYLASKGVEVTTVDLAPELVANANTVAAQTGWSLRNHVMDMRRLDFGESFDHITSVCVFEHIPYSGRIDVTASIRRLLAAGGSFSITFDYDNPSRFARIATPEDVEEQFVRPSGLEVRGNPRLHDEGNRYLLHPFHHPRAIRVGWKLGYLKAREFGLRDLPRIKHENDYTFAALFLRK